MFTEVYLEDFFLDSVFGVVQLRLPGKFLWLLECLQNYSGFIKNS